jgi:UDP:flavonoid glycosyltransferase YjiC (YdhE family)
MRVLFTTWAQSGHYQPMVPLGWALRAAGHEVVVATHPSFAPAITGSGLPALPLGPDIDVPGELRRRSAALRARLAERAERAERAAGADGSTGPGGQAGGATATRVRHRDLPESQYGREVMRVITEGCAAMIDEVLEFARAWRPDLVVFEPTGLLGPLVADVLGIPAVRQLWAPDFTVGMQAFAARVLEPVLTRLGLDDVDITGRMTLDPCPPRMQVRDGLVREPVRYVGYNGPMTMPRRLLDRPARPRVCLTWGTSLHTVGLQHTYLAPRVVRVLGALDVDVVVAALPSQRELFDELPANVVHFGPVPLLGLLPTCAAVVHQSGAGSTMSSVISGVPQLAIATLAETAINGRLMAAAGAGFHLLDEEASVERVHACMSALLHDPGYAAAASRLRDEALALPSPAEAVGRLEKLVAQG